MGNSVCLGCQDVSAHDGHILVKLIKPLSFIQLLSKWKEILSLLCSCMEGLNEREDQYQGRLHLVSVNIVTSHGGKKSILHQIHSSKPVNKI